MTYIYLNHLTKPIITFTQDKDIEHNKHSISSKAIKTSVIHNVLSSLLLCSSSSNEACHRRCVLTQPPPSSSSSPLSYSLHPHSLHPSLPSSHIHTSSPSPPIHIPPQPYQLTKLIQKKCNIKLPRIKSRKALSGDNLNSFLFSGFVWSLKLAVRTN